MVHGLLYSVWEYGGGGSRDVAMFLVKLASAEIG